MMIENEISLEEICKNINNNWENCSAISDTNSITIDFHRHTGIRLFIRRDEKNHFPNIHMFCKTDSWHFDGDRTDLHEIISISFAAFIRLYFIDCSIRLIEFTNDFGADDEIESVYLKVEQINPALNGDFNNSKVLGAIESFVWGLVKFEEYFWKNVGCSCKDCRKESGLTSFFEYELSSEKEKRIQGAIKTGKRVNHCQRNLPNWSYYKDFDNSISIIECKPLVELLKEMYASNNNQLKVLNGINGKFFISQNIKNFIINNSIKKASNILKKLENGINNQIRIIPIENCFLMLGENFLLVNEADCGFNAYRNEKEIVRKRNREESQLLFQPSEFIWSSKINPEKFESLIKELLEKERFYNWVRKAGSTRERDNGRDLLAEKIDITKITLDANGCPIYQSEIKKLVVQCKAYAKSVGKSDVSDIRDTIEFHKAKGFFLAVSSHITNPLISHLETLKENQGYYIDWWTKDEIEKRLKLNEDILLKYSDIVSAK